jgi:hypothetical protein
MSELWTKVKQGASSYMNLYNPVSKKEGFTGSYDSIRSIIWLIMACFALYLSWKHNLGRLDVIHAIVAILCPPIYIIYIFAIGGGQNIFKTTPTPAAIRSA